MKSAMFLKNTLINTSREPGKKRTSRFIVIALFVIVFSAIAILSAVHYSNNKAQDRYEEIIETINKEIMSFNTVVDKYNDLVKGLNQRQFKSEVTTLSKMEKIKPNYDLFVTNGSDYDSLNSLINSIKSERTSIEAKYNKECDAAISKACNDYNIDANKYNAIIDRLKGYENIVFQDDVKKVDLMSPESISFTDNISLFSLIDKSISDKEKLGESYYSLCLKTYNDAIKDYNLVAEEYNKAVKLTSIDFIKGLSNSIQIKEEYEDSEIIKLSEDALCASLEDIFNDTDNIIDEYLVVTQITNPSTAFVYERLEEIDGITGIETVSMTNDPNGLLGKEGGYTGCLYFTFQDVDSSSVPGTTIVDKGTDAGGSVELYRTLDEALARCDYLSQFDGTLLYSGSYAIIGTMVIRTSYKLDNKQQVDLTNEITKRLTELTDNVPLQ